MTNFKIEFTHPLLLLTLIVAIGFALFTFFRSGKRYRNNRNRIVSLVLHVVIMVLCISVLAGITFSYDEPNTENEVLLVVDVSDSEYEAKQRRDAFVKSIIEEGGDSFKMGIVTFGYNQVYAVPLTNNSKSIYDAYLDADLPDTSASDVSSALEFAKEQLSVPQTAKIVLISDGMQTDTNALGIIRSIVDKGTKVDTAYYASEYGNDLQIVNVATPDYNVIAGESFKLGVDLQSSYVGEASVTIEDVHTSGTYTSQYQVNVVNDLQTLELDFSLALPGLHEIRVSVQSDNDTLENNNVYCTYINLEKFTEILLVETYDGEADKLADLLADETDFEVTRFNIRDPQFPTTISELREFDQIIMANVSSMDMPAGFDKVLTKYVEELGGGLFTFGGNKYDEEGNPVLGEYDSKVPNAYNPSDNYNPNNPAADEHPNPTYQDLLPVKAEKYSPPVGVVIIIDRSGSMGGPYGNSDEIKLDWAKIGAKACIEALNARDYVGIMTLEDYYNEDAQLTPVTHKNEIHKAIDNIELGGGTVFKGALERAGAALLANKSIEKRHIILISDGMPFDAASYMSPEGFGPEIIRLKGLGVTLSTVMVQVANPDAEELMRNCAENLGGGRYHNIMDYKEFTTTMMDELSVKEIKAYNPEPFVPTVATQNAILNGIDVKNMPKLGGFYGTQTKRGATEVLSGEFVPVYSTWKVGKGRVGSFMSDLNGEWSNDWLNTSTGKKLIINIINSNFPTENVEGHEISVQLKKNNYQHQLNISAGTKDGEWIEVKVSNLTDSKQDPLTFKPNADGGYARINFELTQTGLYKIEVQKYSATGQKIGKAKVDYTAFSYSQEYDSFADATTGIDLLDKLAELGGGSSIKEAAEIFENARLHIHTVINPKPTFVVISLVLFLLDIAVRKFKFKWPHEMVRDAKLKKQLKQK